MKKIAIFLASVCLASSLHAQTPRTEAEVYAYRQAMQSANRDLQSGNVQAAFATIKAQAELGFVEAQYILATLYHDGEGTAQDIAQAKLWYERAAAQADNAEIAALAQQALDELVSSK